MPRQSGRLKSKGYYDDDEENRLLYKESPYKSFTRKKRGRRISGVSTVSTSSTMSGISFDDTPGPGSSWREIMLEAEAEETKPAAAEEEEEEEEEEDPPPPAAEKTETLCHQALSVLLLSNLCSRFSQKTLLSLLCLFLLCLGGGLYKLYASSRTCGTSGRPYYMGGCDSEWRAMQTQLAKLQEDMGGVDVRGMQLQLTDLHGEVFRLRNKLLPVADTMPNFALESQGATISYHLTSETYHTRPPLITFWGIPLWYLPTNPRTVIQAHSSPLTPGQCWAFGGRRGHVFISLSHPITITHVTLGHISSMQAPAGFPYSAPREFSVYGKNTVDGEGTRLGTFVYDPNGESLQTFKLPGHTKGVFRCVRLQIESNWGHPEYTCIYNFRVHGKMPHMPVTN